MGQPRETNAFVVNEAWVSSEHEYCYNCGRPVLESSVYAGWHGCLYCCIQAELAPIETKPDDTRNYLFGPEAAKAGKIKRFLDFPVSIAS